MVLRPAAAVFAGAAILAACGDGGETGPSSGVRPDEPGTGPSDGGSASPKDAAVTGDSGGGSSTPCTATTPLTVRFYDAGQALSALLLLPDGRRILVDAGESGTRPCTNCALWHQRV